MALLLLCILYTSCLLAAVNQGEPVTGNFRFQVSGQGVYSLLVKTSEKNTIKFQVKLNRYINYIPEVCQIKIYFYIGKPLLEDNCRVKVVSNLCTFLTILVV